LPDFHQGKSKQIQALPGIRMGNGRVIGSQSDAPYVVDRTCLDQDLFPGTQQKFPQMLVLRKFLIIAGDDNGPAMRQPQRLIKP